MALNAFIVEDSPVITKNLVAALEELAPVVVVGTATDEPTAVAWLEAHPGKCDLVIIDIFLAAGSGLGVIKAAVRLAKVPVLAVLTNCATDEMRRQCMELGAHRVFDKSKELDALIDFCHHLGTAQLTGS